MSDEPTPEEAPPSARPRATPPKRFLPWWLPGLLVGLVAAVATVAVLMVRPVERGTHKATAFVQLRPKAASFANKTPDEFAEYRNRQKFLLKSRDLITSVLKEPAVSSLDSVKRVGQAGDPVQMIEAQLRVAEVTEDVLEVTMTGNEPGDMKVILEHLVKRYIDDTTAFERRSLDDRLKQHEQYAETLRLDIEAMENQIALIGKANGTSGSEDDAPRLALLHKQHFEADAERTRLEREINKLDAELTVLKRQAAQKNDAPLDPTREARLSKLATDIEIKQLEREKIRTLCDSLKKLIDASVNGGINISAMRKSLQPQRDTLEKINVTLAQLRLERAMDARVSLRGDVTVEPIPRQNDRTALALLPVAAFAGGFVLATDFSFVGLVFRVLRQRT